jgi:hypothetical protein
MNEPAATIKAIIEAQGLTYLRTVNINDLNARAIDTDLSGGVGIYANLPEIDNETFEASNNVISNVSIEVYYLKLNPELDDKGEAIDTILEDLRPFADGFYDKISRSPIISASSYVDGYDLTAVDTFKLSVEVLTGWRIAMVLPIDRKTFYCE